MAATIDYLTPTLRDYDLPSKFIEHSKDSTIPIAVLGNGGSIDSINRKETNTINDCRLFRCNWAFRDPSKIKKEYAFYLSQAYGSETTGKVETQLRMELDSLVDQNEVFIYRYWTNILYTHQYGLSYIDPFGLPVWPTSGLQMLLYASYKVSSPSLYIAGIDMYTHNRPKTRMSKQDFKKWMETHGKRFSVSDGSAGTTHSKSNLSIVPPSVWVDKIKEHKKTMHYIEIDILLTMQSFAQCILTNRPVYILHSPFLTKIYKYTEEYIDTIKLFLTSMTQEDRLENIPITYSMWRIVNKIMSEI